MNVNAVPLKVTRVLKKQFDFHGAEVAPLLTEVT